MTVLSAHDPVRVFQQFATIDLISRGRAEMVVGRGSFIEAFPLFGLELKDYDAIFAEKLELLLELRKNARVHWAGRFRPASFARAGELGLPLMVAIIGGQPRRFRPLIDLYRQAAEAAGHQPEKLRVGIHALGHVADTDQQAADEFFPGYAQSFTEIGKERGWAPVTRSHYETLRSDMGAMLVSEPARVAERILAFDEVLGGISRLTFQMSIASLPHSNRMRAIELLGAKVAPLVRGEIKREVLVS